jgi:hypothetical protein
VTFLDLRWRQLIVECLSACIASAVAFRHLKLPQAAQWPVRLTYASYARMMCLHTPYIERRQETTNQVIPIMNS